MSAPLIDLAGVGTVNHDAGAGGGQMYEAGTPAVVGTQPNRLMLAFIQNYDSTPAADIRANSDTGADYQFLANIAVGGANPIEAWALPNPVPGSHTIFEGSAYAHGVAVLIPCYNVDLTHAPTVQSAAGVQALTMTASAVGELVIAAISVAFFDAAPTATDGTPIAGLSASNAQVFASYKPGGAAVSFAWTGISNSAVMAVSLRGVGGGGGSTQRRTMGRAFGRALNRALRGV